MKGQTRGKEAWHGKEARNRVHAAPEYTIGCRPQPGGSRAYHLGGRCAWLATSPVNMGSPELRLRAGIG